VRVRSIGENRKTGQAGFSGSATRHGFELAHASHQAGRAVRYPHSRKIGCVFVLEVEASGHAGGSAGRIVGPCPFTQSAGKILIRSAGRNRYPCLIGEQQELGGHDAFAWTRIAGTTAERLLPVRYSKP